MFTGEDKFLCYRESSPGPWQPRFPESAGASAAGRREADSSGKVMICGSIYSINTGDRPEIRPL